MFSNQPACLFFTGCYYNAFVGISINTRSRQIKYLEDRVWLINNLPDVSLEVWNAKSIPWHFTLPFGMRTATQDQRLRVFRPYGR